MPIVRFGTIGHAPCEALLPRPKPPRRIHWATYLWPGLAHLWIKGSLAGLALALSFSVLLNILILGTLVWPAWLETRLKFVCALGAGLLWLAALWETRCELQRIAAKRQEEAKRAEASDQDDSTSETEQTEENHPNDQRLADAQKHYLRSDWVEAEQLLRRAIRADRRDVEVRLWYVMLLRRTGRIKQALRRLDRLELFDAAEPWRFEINEERRLLSRLAQPKGSTVSTQDEALVEENGQESFATQLPTTSEEPTTAIEQRETRDLLETELLPFSDHNISLEDQEPLIRPTTNDLPDQRDQAA